jgi:hypothetical protein
VLAEYNTDALAAQVTLTVPGAGAVTLTVLQMIAAAGCALVVAWLAGQVDRGVWSVRLRRREAALRALEHEIAQVKASVYDREPTVMDVSLTSIHKRLERIEQQLDLLRRREGGAAVAPEDGRVRQPAMT